MPLFLVAMHLLREDEQHFPPQHFPPFLGVCLTNLVPCCHCVITTSINNANIKTTRKVARGNKLANLDRSDDNLKISVVVHFSVTFHAGKLSMLANLREMCFETNMLTNGPQCIYMQ